METRCIKICEKSVNIKDLSRAATGKGTKENSYTLTYPLSTNPFVLIWAHLPGWAKHLFHFSTLHTTTGLNQTRRTSVHTKPSRHSPAVRLLRSLLRRPRLEIAWNVFRKSVILTEKVEWLAYTEPLSPLPYLSFTALITILSNYLYNYEFHVPPVSLQWRQMASTLFNVSFPVLSGTHNMFLLS